MSAKDYFGEKLRLCIPLQGPAEFKFACCSIGMPCYFVQVFYGHRSEYINAANLNNA